MSFTVGHKLLGVLSVIHIKIHTRQSIQFGLASVFVNFIQILVTVYFILYSDNC